MARQYKIVKPDATPEEVREAVESDRSAQVFATAVCSARLTIPNSANKACSSPNRQDTMIHAMSIAKCKNVNETLPRLPKVL